MFGLGMGEILIILVLALLLLGADKLPDAARQLGRGLRDFRKATDDLKSQFEGELYAPEKKPARPTLVEPGAAAAAAAGARKGDGAAPAAEIPVAAAENVPGLDAALVEGGPAPEAPPGPAARST